MTNPATSLLRSALRRAARAYLVGSEIEDAVSASVRLRKQGFSSTIAYWDSPALSAREVASQYGAAVDSLTDPSVDCSLSIKPPSILYDAGVVQGLLSRGQSASRLHFDSLDWTSAEDSFRLLRRCSGVADRLGCTLPGRWDRSIEDTSRVRDLGISVRLVKGQWPDGAGKELEPSAGLLNLARRLAGHRRTVAVASHDVAVARKALLTLLGASTPCELQLLYGLPVRAPLKLARELNVPVRFYLPYGHAWLPYALRQAARKPKILFWLVRDALVARSSGGALDAAGRTVQ